MASRALLVGVNSYRLPGCDLHGCVNDITNMRDVLLKYFDFSAEQVRLLADERATRQAVLERLEWLVGDAGGWRQARFSLLWPRLPGKG